MRFRLVTSALAGALFAVGLVLGAAPVLRAAGVSPNISGLFAIGDPTTPSHQAGVTAAGEIKIFCSSGCTASPNASDQGTLSTWAPNSLVAATMGGLAGSITPSRTGNVQICLFGYVTNSATTADEGIIAFQPSYGTGSAPAANDALTGTQIGAPQKASLATTATAAADINMGLNNCAIVTGLTVGVAYWLDVAGEALTNTTSTWHGAISAQEF